MVHEGNASLSFEIVGSTDYASVAEDKKDYKPLAFVGEHFQFQNFTVAAHGADNQLPALAVSLIKKQSLPAGNSKETSTYCVWSGAGLVCGR